MKALLHEQLAPATLVLPNEKNQLDLGENSRVEGLALLPQ